jgi:glycine/D-amino acid oxidase-like deaminating enzyme
VVGGGIAGLLTAYYAAPLAESVTVLGRAAVAEQVPALIRHDFLDVRRASLAAEAHRLWLELQARWGRRLLRNCGHLNLASAGVTPGVGATAGERGYEVLAQLGLRREALSGRRLASRFPQLAANAAWLDVDAGLIDVEAVTDALTGAVRARGVTVHESATVRGIGRNRDGWHVGIDYGALGCDGLVITAELGTNAMLKLLPGCGRRFPLRLGQPAQSTYFIPEQATRAQFTDLALPAFACPEVGIYGRPIIDGQTPGVRISLCSRSASGGFGSAADFVDACMPGLRGAPTSDPGLPGWVEASDGEFIIGPVPDADGVYAAVGFGRSLCAFAPWIGLVLAQLAIHRDTSFDIARFSPARFA